MIDYTIQTYVVFIVFILHMHYILRLLRLILMITLLHVSLQTFCNPNNLLLSTNFLITLRTYPATDGRRTARRRTGGGGPFRFGQDM